MKKTLLILGLLSFAITSCSNNKEQINIPKQHENIKNDSNENIEIINVFEKGEEIDCYNGYWENVYSGNASVQIDNDYEFNYTILKLNDDFSEESFVKVSGKIIYDNYIITLDGVNLEYFYTSEFNKTSLYLRMDGNKLKYEFRSNGKASFEITKVEKFIKI